MKKWICALLCFFFVLSMTGCQYKVPDPMEYPDYTFPSDPTPEQLREMAIKAMQDMLSIQWCTEKEIRYRKNGPVNKKEFIHAPENTYGGLLYSTASTGIFQFFEYYNTKTGCLEYPGTADELKLELGNSCADALLWAWSTVCNSIKGGFYPVLMVPSNGYMVVGDYTYRQNIQSYNEMPSYAIIENNGNDVILDAYSRMLPADALLSNTDNHAMMVIEAPVVVYTSDGKIDPENSYVMIQDQRAGGSSFYVEEIDGHTVNFSGKLRDKKTFATLLEKNYIPVTTAEFIGAKTYDKATVSVDHPCNSIADLQNVTVEANYPLAVLNILSVDSSGTQTVLLRKMFGGADMYGVPRSFALSEFEGLEELTSTPRSTIKLEVVVATGERFYPISFTA